MTPRRRRWLFVPLVLVGLLVLVVVGFVVRGSRIASARYEVAPAGLTVAADSALVAHGARLSKAMGCQDCHGADLGGRVLADAPPFRLVSTNLTRGQGGIGVALTPDAMERALRHGVGHDGRPLWTMPTIGFRHLSASDVAALAAYVASVRPVDRDSGALVLKPLGRVLAGAGQLAPEVFPDAAPGPATTPDGPALGAYLADVGCRHCHGADLGGAPHPDPAGPASPTLAAAAAWPLPVFTAALRSGKRPSGVDMNPAWMPWSSFAALTDAEIAALHAYLQTYFGVAQG